MGYPQKLLANGETIEFELKPHWRGLVWPGLLLIIEAFAATFLLTKLSPDGFSGILRWIIIAAVIVILIGWVIVPFLRWMTAQYVFTNRRVIIRRGLIAKQGRDMPLSKVNNVTFNVSVLGRFLNYGDLLIESAGEDSGLDINDVPNVEVVQREVYRLHEEDDERRRRRSTELGGDPVPPTDGT